MGEIRMEYFLVDKTQQLIRGFFAVQNEVGLGRNEEAYQRAFEIWTHEQRLPVASKPPVQLRIRDRGAHTLYPDFVGWDEIVVELKALPRAIGPSESLQLFDYLRARRSRLGLIVNMGLDRVHVERRILDPVESTLAEDFSYWANHIDGSDRDIGVAIRNALHLVYAEHRTGYSLPITERLLLTALSICQLDVTVRPIAPAMFHKQVVHESALECIVVAGKFVMTVTAHFESNEFAKSLGLSHMKTLNAPWGVAANFGIKECQITSLRYGNK
ncbi:MAG: GxxExxY protein [Planctomycetota bacterium]|nr:GxxExxY protein [Planctomycetota bacterium]